MHIYSLTANIVVIAQMIFKIQDSRRLIVRNVKSHLYNKITHIKHHFQSIRKDTGWCIYPNLLGIHTIIIGISIRLKHGYRYNTNKKKYFTDKLNLSTGLHTRAYWEWNAGIYGIIHNLPIWKTTTYLVSKYMFNIYDACVNIMCE